MKYLLLLLSIEAYCSNFNLLKSKKKKVRRARRVQIRKIANLKELQKIEESKEKMKKLLEEMDSSPLVVENALIRAGNIQKGRLINSIDTAQSGSPVIIEFNNSSRLAGSKLLCTAKRVKKRADLKCQTLSTPNKDIQINAKILELDGSLGLVGSYSSGNIGSSIIEGIKAFGRGVLGYSKTRVSSDRGKVIDSSIQNQTIDGLGNVLDSGADDYLKNNIDNSESVKVSGGRDVLIYFNREVNY